MTTLDTTVSPTSAQEPQQASLKNWLAVITVAVGVFALVTAEQLPVGLLPFISSSLTISEGTAGLTVTIPGLVAAGAAPLVPILVGRLDRRWLLVWLLGLMGIAHAISVIAPNFTVLLISRVLVGLSIGGFWAIAGTLAIRLVPERLAPKATSIIFRGVAAANVLGVPAGTLIGELMDWRAAFATLGGLGLLTLLGLLFWLPRLPASEPVRPRTLLAQFGNPGVRAAIIATFLLVTGHFAAYTFVSPILQDISHLNVNMISSVLLVYGTAGLIGNFIAGWMIGRAIRPTILVITIALAMTMALFPLLGRMPISGVILLILWGLSYGGVSVSLQTWIIKAAPKTAEAATALMVSMFNFSIAFGALIGGFVVDSLAIAGALWLGSVLVLLTGLSLWSIRKTPLA